MPGSHTDAARPGAHPLEVAAGDYLWFCDLALDTMAGIVKELGDDLANRRPPFPGANSPYVILTHCLGVLEYWGGATIAARPVERDRAAEFTASGPVEPLLRRTAEARRRLADDIKDLDPWAEPPNVYRGPDDVDPYKDTKGAVLLHVLEELFQHLGQMELTRDTR